MAHLGDTLDGAEYDTGCVCVSSLNGSSARHATQGRDAQGWNGLCVRGVLNWNFLLVLICLIWSIWLCRCHNLPLSPNSFLFFLWQTFTQLAQAMLIGHNAGWFARMPLKAAWTEAFHIFYIASTLQPLTISKVSYRNLILIYRSALDSS